MLNVRKFTQQRERLEQTLLLKAENDLEGLISRDISCHLIMDGKQDEKYRPVLSGQVNTELSSVCQVCNQDFRWQHAFEFEVYPVSEEMLQELDEDLEVVLCEQDMLNIEHMLRHELILSLPTVICHETTVGEDCSKSISMRAGDEVPKKESPFAILNQLKSKDFKD
jgi:uncharacterized metal-binding protein YceD (DUF177 family)